MSVDDQIGQMLKRHFIGLQAGFRLDDVIALLPQHQAKGRADRFFVIDEQYLIHRQIAAQLPRVLWRECPQKSSKTIACPHSLTTFRHGSMSRRPP